MKRLSLTVWIFLLIAGIHSTAAQNISQIRFGSSGDPLNGLTIAWNSQGSADSIAWGYSSGLEHGKFPGVISTTITGTRFEYTFPVLTAGSSIHYALFDSKDSIWTEERTYITASDASGNQFSFTAFGDSRTNLDDWKIISEATLETDFTLFMGDIVHHADKASEWQDWFDYGAEFISRELVYHCVGNHDKDTSQSEFDNFSGLYNLPGNELYYSFTYGNAVFICLNSEDPSGTEQYDWLLSTLETNKDQTWKIVFFHRPFFTEPDPYSNMDAYFTTWWKAFDDYGVDMIFNGHIHHYARTKPINRNISTDSPVASYGSEEGQGRCQVITGSAGAPLVDAASSGNWWLEYSLSTLNFCNIDIDGHIMTFQAMDKNHYVFDEFTIEKSTVGTDDFKNSKITLFPNPSNGELYVKALHGEIFNYRIFNSSGQLISEVQNARVSDDPVRIDLNNQSTGIYYIELSTEKGISTEKVILF